MATVTELEATNSVKSIGNEIDALLHGIASKRTTVPVYQCNRCEDSGYIFDFETRTLLGRCECEKERRAEKLATWRETALERLRGLVSERVDLAKTQRRTYMTDIGTQSIWLHGRAGSGKTHCAAYYIEQAINTADAPFEWGWYPIRKLVDAWRSQYDDFVDMRIEALTILRQLEREEIIVIDDIDKIGTITSAREEEFFNLIDSIHGRKAQLIVTSQNDIDIFCDRMSREALLIRRDGIGPQQRRLKEICKEIRL